MYDSAIRRRLDVIIVLQALTLVVLLPVGLGAALWFGLASALTLGLVWFVTYPERTP